MFYKKAEIEYKNRVIKLNYKSSVIIAQVEKIIDDHIITYNHMYQSGSMRTYNYGYSFPISEIEKVYPKGTALLEAVIEFEKEKETT